MSAVADATRFFARPGAVTWASPDELAAAFASLTTATYVTGVAPPVDGGLSLT